MHINYYIPNIFGQSYIMLRISTQSNSYPLKLLVRLHILRGSKQWFIVINHQGILFITWLLNARIIHNHVTDMQVPFAYLDATIRPISICRTSHYIRCVIRLKVVYELTNWLDPTFRLLIRLRV